MVPAKVIYRKTGSTWINANDYIFNKDFTSLLEALAPKIQFNKNQYFVIRKSDFSLVACQPTEPNANRYENSDTITIDTSEYFQF